MRSIVIGLCLVAASALAQKTEPSPKKQPAAQRVIFDSDDLIEGGLQHPTGEIYSVPPRAKFGSLIQVRMNFNDKLRESVHEM